MNAAKAQITVEMDASGLERGGRQAVTALGSLQTSVRGVGQSSGHAKTALDSLEGTTDKVGKTTKVTAGAVDSLRNAIGGLIGVVSARELINFTVETAKMNATAQITAKTFENLAFSAGTTATMELNKLRRAVGGTMSDLELMQKVGAGVDAGMTFEQSRIALEYLRRYANAYGKDFNQLTQTIFTGLQRGSVLMLDDAGIILSATDSIFDGLGELEKKSALVGEAIGMMSEKMANYPRITANAVTETDRLTVAWKNLKEAIGGDTERVVSGASSIIAGLMDIATQGLTDKNNMVAQNREGLRLVAAQAWTERGRAQARAKLDIMEMDANRQTQTTRDPLSTGRGTVVTTMSAAEQRAVQQAIEATKKREEAQKRLNEEIRLQTEAAESQQRLQNRLAFEDEMRHNEDIQRMRLEAIEARNREDETLAATLEADAARLESRQQVTTSLAQIEARASVDRMKIIQTDLYQSYLADARRLREAGASTDELTRLWKAYETERTRVTKDENDKRAKDESEAKIRKVLLVFTADASQVETESDLAAFSVGLLVQEIRSISPAASQAVAGVAQIVSGMVAGGPGGVATAALGGLTLLKTGIDGVMNGSRMAEEQIRRLNDAIEDAGNASGRLAMELEREAQTGLANEFRQRASDLFGQELRSQSRQVITNTLAQSFVNLDTLTVDLEGLEKALNKFSSEHSILYASRLQFLQLATELEQVEQQMRRFNGEVFDFRQAMDEFNFALRFQDIADPTAKLTELNRVLAQIGVTVDSAGVITGLESLSLETLNLNEQRQLKLTVKDILQDVTQIEIEARKKEADILISAIQSQARQVQDALEAAQKATEIAVLRQVSAIFDIQEIALRQSFVPSLIGARTDPLATARVIAEAFSEIELLRLAEQSETTRRLTQIRDHFTATASFNEQANTLQIQAITQAAQDTSMTFKDAITQQTQELLVTWVESLNNTVLGKPVLPADLIDLRTQVLLDMSAIISPVGVAAVDLATALRPFGVTDVDLRDALALQGVKFLDVNEFFEPVGVSIVDLAQALTLSGTQTVDLVQALRVSGQVTVPANDVLRLTGSVDLPAGQVLAMTGVSTQLDDQMRIQRDIASYTWAANEHLWAIRQAGGLGGGTVTVPATDMTRTNSLLQEIAMLNATMVQLQFARRSVVSDLSMEGLGGFAGFNALAALVSRNLPSYDTGGTVPGPVGRPQLAVVHGGETIYRPGEGRQVVVRMEGPMVNLNITVDGDGGTDLRDQIEEAVVESMRDGRIHQTLQNMMTQVVRQSASAARY